MPPEPIKLPEKHENTPEECDAVLGFYMRAWNHLEIAMLALFIKLVDIDIVTATIIFNSGIDQRTLRGILDAIGKQRLRKEDYTSLSRLLRRMKDAASTRNKLVHGVWELNLVMGDEPLQAEKAEWKRFYRPADPETYHKISGKRPDQKLLAAHRYTLDRIMKIAKEVHGLSQDVGAFEKSASLLPKRIPQPAF